MQRFPKCWRPVTNTISVYAAGAATDNPGQAGIGLIIVSASGLVREFSENIGIATADQAIMQAIVRALKLISDRRKSDIVIYLRNAELAEKLKQNIEITDEYLRGLWLQIKNSSENLHTSYEFSQSVNSEHAEELAKKASLDDPEQNTNPNAIRHAIQQSAGGVVYKKDKGLLKVCLIAKKDGDIWALPKGRVKAGETWEKAAIREILEETGHLATISGSVDKIDYFFYWKANRTLYYKMVSFFLMPLVSENFAERDGEADDLGWFTFQEAWHKVYYQSEKNIIRQAQNILKNSGI